MRNEVNGASLQAVIARLEDIFDKLNKHLFNGELERPVITVSPDTTKFGAFGWCTGWKAWEGAKEGGYYEINMCAEHLSRTFDSICGTLLHEMIHLKNLHDNVKDTCRSGTYHNKRFKSVAERHGLTVKKDSKYGYCRTWITNEVAEWLSTQYPDETGFALHRNKITKLSATGKKSSSRKYICHSCGTSIRASKKVNVICGDCGVEFEEEEKE